MCMGLQKPVAQVLADLPKEVSCAVPIRVLAHERRIPAGTLTNSKPRANELRMRLYGK